MRWRRMSRQSEVNSWCRVVGEGVCWGFCYRMRVFACHVHLSV